MHRYVLSLLCGTALATAASAANAQAAGAAPAAQAPRVEEIVVTARKREESLQRVPVAVSVVSAQQLKNNLATDLTTVAELAPQVSIAQAGAGTGAVITVRGVSSDSNDAGLDQSVAVEVDGIPLSRGQIISSSIFDMAQVQVLEGPQALFFGKNSPAGVISLRSADPTNRFEGYVTGGYEFVAHERFVEGAVSGPLTDTLKARLAFRFDKMRGWIKNTAGPLTDIINPAVTDPGATMGGYGPDGHDYAGRLILLWTPTSDFDARLKVQLDEKTMNGQNAASEGFCINGQTQPVVMGVVPIPGGDCAKDMVKSQGSVAPQYAANFPYGNGGVPYETSKFSLASVTLNKHFDKVTVTSETGYYNQIVEDMYNADWSPYATIAAASKESYRLVTQELRANTNLDGPVNLMGGIYYEHFNRPFFNAPDLYHVFNPAAGNYTATNMFSTTTGRYYSAFGQLRWNIVPDVELAAGARWSHDEKDFQMENVANGPLLGAALYPSGQVLRSHYSDDNVSPEVTLSWHPAPDQTLYGAYKTGYKAGGVSNAFLVYANATPDNIQFKPEKAHGGEIGYKGTALDRRVRFDLTAYRYQYEDLQVVSYDAQTISFTIQNAASARIQGLEGSGEFAATDALTLRGNFGWNDAKYLSFPNAPCFVGQTTGCQITAANPSGVQNLAGQTLLRAPKLTFSLGGDYKLPTLAGWSGLFSTQVSRTSSYNAATDHGPGGVQPAYWLVNASLRFGPENGHYELAVIGRNLTNAYYMLDAIGWSGSNSNNQYVGFFNRPREVVLQATARW